MYRKVLFVASLLLASSARAQTADGPLTNNERQSSFRAEIRGDLVTSASGEAQFGAVQNPDRSSGAFVLSLGACSDQGAILITRRSGAPLEVGRYRISAGAEGENEILALVLTGPPTRPTGARSGASRAG